MDRGRMVERLSETSRVWDLLVIGGGATGVGVALDAASRGYATALLERGDLGQGSSSRSTKLIHGGLRYLRQGNPRLVRSALRERGILARLAPHLVRSLDFVIPSYKWWETPYHAMGLKAYDALAGRSGWGGSRVLSGRQSRELVPTLRESGLRGGVLYKDGLFDDSRLLVDLARTAVERGAVVANYLEVSRLLVGEGGLVRGVVARDLESSGEIALRARAVVNATGPWIDGIRGQDQPDAAPLIVASQGSHVVLPRRFLPLEAAILVPRTADGRVMFALPWHDHVIVGTTDIALEGVPISPRPSRDEVGFLLDGMASYLSERASPRDVLSAWSGVRPLVRARGPGTTSRLARDHHLEVSNTGLLTICGGKWTTYRRMAEETVDLAASVGGLPRRPCLTTELPIHGHAGAELAVGHLAHYGSDERTIRALMVEHPGLSHRLHEALPITGAEVIWAAREEMARTVEDALARRTRALFLNARAARAMAPRVADLLAAELGRDSSWVQHQITAFNRVAEDYVVPS